MKNLFFGPMVFSFACAVVACTGSTTPDGATGDAADINASDTMSADASDTGRDVPSDTPDATTMDVADVSTVDVPADTFDASVDVAPDLPGDDVIDASKPDASPDDVVDASAPDVADTGVITDAPVDAGPATKRVFVSSATYGANFGGYAGADTACTTLATAAGLGGTWMAWVSTSASSPSARFTHATVPYVRIDGTMIASDWSALTSGSLATGITTDEHGTPVTSAEVWTSTTSSGDYTGGSCNDFTSASASDPYATVGISDAADSTWTSVYDQFCDRTGLRIYCFEQ